MPSIPPGCRCSVILTLVLYWWDSLLHRCYTGSHRGAAGLSSGPCRAQPRLVQWTIEYHIRQDGDFQLLFRPAVLFGEFELWREQAESQSAHVSRTHGLLPRLPRVAGTLTQACPRVPGQDRPLVARFQSQMLDPGGWLKSSCWSS